MLKYKIPQIVTLTLNYVFIEKIKCHKNRVGGTYSKHLPPLYSENIQFTSYLPQQPEQQLMKGEYQ